MPGGQLVKRIVAPRLDKKSQSKAIGQHRARSCLPQYLLRQIVLADLWRSCHVDRASRLVNARQLPRHRVRVGSPSIAAGPRSLQMARYSSARGPFLPLSAPFIGEHDWPHAPARLAGGSRWRVHAVPSVGRHAPAVARLNRSSHEPTAMLAGLGCIYAHDISLSNSSRLPQRWAGVRPMRAVPYRRTGIAAAHPQTAIPCLGHTHRGASQRG